MDSNKRPDLLVHILPSIITQFPNILVLFVGRDEGMLNYCRDLSNKLKVTENVRFLGYISDKDKHALYEAADIFALVSDKEAFGTVLVEAMANELPVVVTDARGPKSVVQDGINGLIVKRNNAPALAEAILKLLKEDGLRKQLAINARISAENNYSIKNIVTKIESYYYATINERNTLTT